MSAERSAERPRRSCLYMPGTNTRAHDKARTLPADVLIFDLEDSVAPEAKVDARHQVAAAIAGGGFGSREVLVRVNGIGTAWVEDDLRMAARAGAQGVVLPKVLDPADVRNAGDLLDDEEGDAALWAMMETSGGILAAPEIACAHKRLCVMTMGLEDLAKELKATLDGQRTALLYALEACVLAARAHRLGIIDAVYPAFDDDEGFAAACAQGRMLGFDGKQVIHPRQIAAANEAFGPSAEEVAEARRVIEAFEAAARQGDHVAKLDGRMVEALHAAEAKRIVGLADAIARLEAESQAQARA
ncbi:MAG TPA: CoA ester lyase [Alphaproteobacteria bacterium]|nr:CoA ester lyase [Alphaproteobacteria bacterium]